MTAELMVGVMVEVGVVMEVVVMEAAALVVIVEVGEDAVKLEVRNTAYNILAESSGEC
ncbi:hypothetical protein E2C01_098348 [Portunus trituberculatus]|uniref:Uncharacterized protein n=1 Tax=Portunus trituberculatus TaxID=210409 RepID=A0A5B7K862_PORTR|nr:hypothetical protein [Portunus trituberculatus]